MEKNYLRRTEKKYLRISCIWFLICLIFFLIAEAILIYLANNKILGGVTTFLSLLVGIPACLAIIYFFKIINEYINISDNYWKGYKGEEAVYNILKTIPDIKIIKDIVLPDRKGNIDFVVLHTSGIYLLELKTIGLYLLIEASGILKSMGERLRLNLPPNRQKGLLYI